MQIIQLPDGKNAEFPDDMPLSEIQGVLKKKFPPSNQNEDQKNLVKYATGMNRTPIDLLRDIAGGVVGGLGRGGQALANAFTGGNAPQGNINALEEAISSPNKSIGGEFAKGASSYAPYGIAGGPSFLGQVGAGAGFGAANTEPNESNLFGILPEGRMGGAIKNALINAITHGGFQLFNSLRPSKVLRGNLSPEQLQGNAGAAEGTTTDLGNVIGSPFLKRQYENVLSKVPFSGANEKLQKAGEAVETQGNNILKEMLGNNNPESVSDDLFDALMGQFKSHRENKNNLYKEFNQEASKQFLPLPLSKFAEKAKEYRAAIKDSNLLKHEPKVKAIFDKLLSYTQPVKKIPGNKNPVNEFGEKVIGKPLTTHKYPTAEEANILKGMLNEYAESYKSSPTPSDRRLGGIFSELASSLKSDIKETISKSGNIKLQNAYEKAEKNYAENFSPFLDKDIYKFIGGSKDSDLLVQNFLKTSQMADRGKLLEKLQKTLPPNQKKLLAYSYFSRALDKDGNLNPAKLSTLIKKLGKNQFNTLVPDKNLRESLSNFSKLYNMNTKAVNLMQNPATGQQNLDILPLLLGHAGSSLTGGMMGGLPGALLGLVAPGIASKALVNKLTNPLTRTKLIEKMIKNKNWNKNAITGIQTAERGLGEKK